MPPPLGSVLELELEIPQFAARGRATAVVRWVREPGASCEGVPPGFGAQWLELPEHLLLGIREFVRRRDTILYECA